jgi:hypothetical protein
MAPKTPFFEAVDGEGFSNVSQPPVFGLFWRRATSRMGLLGKYLLFAQAL